MDIDLSKLLGSCKNSPSFGSFKVKKHWSSPKILMRKSKKNFTQSIVLKDSQDQKQSRNSSFYVKVNEFSPNPSLEIYSKKIVLCKKDSLGFTPARTGGQCSVSTDKVFHTYARPNKLRSLNLRIGSNNIEISEGSGEVKTMVPSVKKVGNKSEFVIKKCGSKGLLRRNEYFNEPYLKNFAENFKE